LSPQPNTTPSTKPGGCYRQKGNAMNLLSFLLILSVVIVIKEELLTYALIIWGLVLLGRFMLRHYIAANQPKMGRMGRD